MKFISLLAYSFLIASVAGCGGGPKLGHVSGTVTVDGRPVTQGTIMFIPEDGKAAVGSINPDGTYTLTTYVTDDGALVGDHKVTIQATTVGSSSMVPASFEDELALANGKSGHKYLVPGRVDWIVPERYSQVSTSDLTATVSKGRQIIDFTVPNR